MYSTRPCPQPLRWHSALAAFLSLASMALSTSTEPAPIVLDPSQYWEGNDGPWSTFSMQIGDSGNVTRVLVSTAIPNPWVVLDSACTTTACATSRGGSLFNPNASSTWSDKGIFDLYYEDNLNYTGNGDYGYDTVGLGLNPTNASTANNQLVVGIIADDFWLGYLGINPQVTNFQSFNTSVPSLISSLRSNGAIPSITYSYTAGAQYRNKGVYGQLILGGYDSSRFQPNNIDFNMAGDVTRDLVVGIQSLQSQESNGKTTNLLNEGILAYIDSTVPWIVLPDDACDTIEQTFGISQDDTTGLYLISDAQHNALTSRNPNFTFVLGNNQNGGNTVPITLPYSSFDLQISAPYVNTSSKYFPLKRGNDTTYTLGRAFLQESYLIANYEHQNFSISQALFNEGAQKSIQPLYALGYVPPVDGTNDSSSSSSSGGISTGAIVGIVIAVVVILIAFATLAILRHQRRWPFHNRSPSGLSELNSDENIIGHEKDGTPMRRQYRDISQKNPIIDHASSVEADSKDSLHGFYRPELAGTDSSAYKSELPGSGGHPANKIELPGSHGATEVEASPGFVMELPGSPVGTEYFRRQDSDRLHSASSGSGPSPRSPVSAGSHGRDATTLSPLSARKGSDVSPDHVISSSSRADVRSGRGIDRTPVSPQSPESHSTPQSLP